MYFMHKTSTWSTMCWTGMNECLWLLYNLFLVPLQPCFDMFYNHVKKLFSNDATLTHMEKCSLMEALVLISNQFKDFAKQKAFLDELMASVVAEWTSEEMRRCVWTPSGFCLNCTWCILMSEQIMNRYLFFVFQCAVGPCRLPVLCWSWSNGHCAE